MFTPPPPPHSACSEAQPRALSFHQRFAPAARLALVGAATTALLTRLLAPFHPHAAARLGQLLLVLVGLYLQRALRRAGLIPSASIGIAIAALPCAAASIVSWFPAPSLLPGHFHAIALGLALGCAWRTPLCPPGNPLS